MGQFATDHSVGTVGNLPDTHSILWGAGFKLAADVSAEGGQVLQYSEGGSAPHGIAYDDAGTPSIVKYRVKLNYSGPAINSSVPVEVWICGSGASGARNAYLLEWFVTSGGERRVRLAKRVANSWSQIASFPNFNWQTATDYYFELWRLSNGTLKGWVWEVSAERPDDDNPTVEGNDPSLSSGAIGWGSQVGSVGHTIDVDIEAVGTAGDTIPELTPVLSAPNNFSATGESTGIEPLDTELGLSWDAVTGADSYHREYQRLDSNQQPIGDVFFQDNITTTSETITGLDRGWWRARVAAWSDADGERGNWTDWQSTKIPERISFVDDGLDPNTQYGPYTLRGITGGVPGPESSEVFATTEGVEPEVYPVDFQGFPTGYTPRYQTTNSTWSAHANGGVRHTSTQSGRRILTPDFVPLALSHDTIFEFELLAAPTGASARLHVRASGTAEEANALYITLQPNRVAIERYVDGQHGLIDERTYADLGVTPKQGGKYAFRLKADPESGTTRILAKFWSLDQDQPESWQFNTTNNSVTVEGNAGPGAFSAGNDVRWIRGVVALNGAEATLEPVDTDPTPPVITLELLEWNKVVVSSDGTPPLAVERNDAIIAPEHGSSDYEDSNLEPQTEYTYRVGYPDLDIWSEPRSITTGSDPAAPTETPGKIQGLQVEPVGHSRGEATWQPDSQATYYIPTLDGIDLDPVAEPSTSFRSLDPETEYIAEVRGGNDLDEGPKSDPFPFTTGSILEPPPPPPPENIFEIEISRSHQLATLVEVITPHLGVVLELHPIGGQVDINTANDIRTRASLSIAGEELTPVDAQSLLTPMGTELRIHRGVRYGDGSEELKQIGTVVISDVSTDGETIEITGVGLSRRIQRNTMVEPYPVQAGLPIHESIRAIILDRYPEALFNLENLDDVTAWGIIEGDPWKAVMEIAIACGCELYDNHLGEFELRMVPDPDDAPVMWRFREGETVTVNGHPIKTTLTEISRQLTDEDTFNRVVILAEGSNLLEPVIAEAVDDNPTSPTYIEGDYGVVTKSVVDPKITTRAQAEASAQARLRQVKGLAERVSLSAVPNPALRAGQAVEVYKPNIGIDARYIIDSLTMPLTPDGEMTLGMRQRRL